MTDRLVAPETLPRCPVCEKRVLCVDDAELSAHVEKCFEEHAKPTFNKYKVQGRRLAPTTVEYLK